MTHLKELKITWKRFVTLLSIKNSLHFRQDQRFHTKILVNILCFCEDRLDSIGDSILINAFHEIRKEPISVIIQKCLIEITQVDREINKNYKVLDFLFNCINEFEQEFMFLKTIIFHFFDT